MISFKEGLVVVCAFLSLTVTGWLFALPPASPTLSIGNESESAAASQARPAPTHDGFLKFADRQIQEGDYAAAIVILEKQASQGADDPRLLELLGIAYDSDRQAEKARPCFEKAGTAYLAGGNLVKAAEMLGFMQAAHCEKEKIDAFSRRLEETRKGAKPSGTP